MPKQKTDPQEIVKSALNIFLEKGYHNTSMADIANETGLLKGSLYHHFKGKEDLMKAVISSIHEWYKREIFTIKDEKTFSTDQKIQALIKASEEIFFNRRGGNFMTNIALETLNVVPEFTAMFRAFFRDWIHCVKTVYAEVFPEDEAEQLAHQSISEIEGAVVMMELFNDKNYLRRAHKRIYNRFKSLSSVTK
ncbi:MAG: TetR/AcrR family transcriptional regulator [Saprospiraceae bacterium]|nr:TetR/AcrR family transcriptional regulator [Saprospiraceae bacterium]